MADKVGLGERCEAGVASPAERVVYVGLPYMACDAVLLPASDRHERGLSYEGWTAHMDHNTVVNEGRFRALNYIFGLTNGNFAGNTWFLGLHSNAGTNSTWQASNITLASFGEISGYTTAANTSTWRHSVSFASNMNTLSTTFGATYVFFTAAQQTVSGPFLIGGSTASGNGQATQATANCALYAVGSWTPAKTVNSNDTLQVTVTLSVA